MEVVLGTKAVFIGLDGLDDAKADALMAAGDMPRLTALRESSKRAEILNYKGMGAGVFWSSAACGVTPDHHGRYFHLQFDQTNYDVRPFEEDKNFKSPAFWKSLDEEGRRVAVLDWHRGPFQKMTRGLLLDNWLGHDATSNTRSYPPEKTQEVLAQYGGDPFAGGSWSRELHSAEDYTAFVEQACERIDTKARLTCDYIAAEDWDLFAPCFSELHDLGHYVYHVTDKDHPRHDPKLYDAVGDPLRPCYLAIDKAVGQIMDAVGPDVPVMALAGPGMMRLCSANTVIEEIARRLDLGVGAPQTTAEQAKTAYRSFIPEKMRRRIAPLARMVRRRSGNGVFAHRRFFGIPHNDNSACIRINVKGREPLGMIEPGSDYEKLLDEIREGLMEIEDADTGVKVVQDVISIRHNYDGPCRDMLPDIFVEWNRNSEAKALRLLRSPRIGEVDVGYTPRTGDHTSTGFFWARGADGPIFDQPGQRRPHEATEVIMNAARGGFTQPAGNPEAGEKPTSVSA